MKKFAELGIAHRIEPCEEYPGTWIGTYPNLETGQLGEEKFSDLASAKFFLERKMWKYQEEGREFDTRQFAIYWKCSDNDPRIGEVWFTGHYIHGKFNIFGNYVQF